MTSQGSGQIRLFVLGDARIETPVGVIEPTAEMVFAAALYLILERGRPVQRSALQTLLWPSTEKSAAAHRLRQTLVKLRYVGIPVSRIGKSRLASEIANVSIDCDDFVGSIPETTDLLQRNFALFGGYAPSFSSLFLEWLDRAKERFSARVTQVLLAGIARNRATGNWISVEQHATALQSVNSYNEEAILALAEARAMRGAKKSASDLLSRYLDDVGIASRDLRIQATLLRKRITEQTTPDHSLLQDQPMFGRSEMLEELSEMLSSTKAGSGVGCIVLGEAGIGKSRLLDECSRFASLQGVTVQKVQCRPSHKHRPLSVFVELVPMLRSLRGAIGCDPQTLESLDRLTQHTKSEEVSVRDESDPGWLYNRVLKSLFDLLDAVSDEAPLLIQIEDVHWLDLTSARVLGDMIGWARSHPIMFALSGRESPDEWLSEAPDSLRRILLPPIDDSASTELLLTLVRTHGQAIDESHLHWCVRVADGNPYFLQELGTHWVQAGTTHEVPHSLNALLALRVDRLTEDALLLMQTCALLENNATLQRLESILEYEPHRFLKSINELSFAGMLIVEKDEIDGTSQRRMSTKHDLLSDIASRRLAEPARVFLHRRAGLILEGEIGSNLSTTALWDAAKHWNLAGDSERALSLAMSCARHLMNVGLPGDAAKAFARCLPLCTSDSQRAEVLENETVAYYRLNDWVSVRKTAAVVRVLKHRIEKVPATHDDLELMDFRAEWLTSGCDAIVEKALTCLTAAEAPPRHRAEGGVMAMMLLSSEGDKERITTSYRQIETICAEGEVERSLLLQARMVYHTGFGSLEDGVAAARELLVETAGSGTTADLFRAYINASVTFRTAGLMSDARNSLLRALQLAELHRLDPALITVITKLVSLALETGDIDAARHWCSRFNELSIDASNRCGQLDRATFKVRLALLENNLDTALLSLGLTRDEAMNEPIHFRRAYHCALQVAVDLLAFGTTPQETLDCLVDAHEHVKSGLHQGYAACVAYAGLVRCGKRRKAEALFNAYVKFHRREPWPVPSHLFQGLLPDEKLYPTSRGAGCGVLRRS